MKPRVPYSDLKNIGPVSLGWLREIGISRRADLIRQGAVQVFLKVKRTGRKPTLNLLWALAGAERGLAWNRLSTEQRERLLLELDAAEEAGAAPPAAVQERKPVSGHRPAASSARRGRSTARQQ